MSNGSVLFHLLADNQGAYDGSIKGLGVTRVVGALPLDDAGLRLDRGFVELQRQPDLDNLQSFTIEATITPENVGSERRNILEAQSPAVALFIENDARLMGSVHTEAGWVVVDSGTTRVSAGTTVRVRFARGTDGEMELQMDDRTVGTRAAPQPIRNVGEAGFKIGAGIDGERWPFIGRVADVQIRQGAVNAAWFEQKKVEADRVAATFKANTGLEKVTVNLFSDVSHIQLQSVRDIMNAAGVRHLDDLDTLRLVTRTVMPRGRVLVAPRKIRGFRVNWSGLATEILTADAATRRDLLAKNLTNRNSASVLGRLQVAGASFTSVAAHAATVAPATVTAEPAAAAVASPVDTSPVPLVNSSVPRLSLGSPVAVSDGRRIRGLNDEGHTGARLPVELLQLNPTLRYGLQIYRVPQMFKEEGNELKLSDASVLSRLEASTPALWPMLSEPATVLRDLTTIPVNSAVIVAATLDLTETTLLIEPDVTTLYIIADKITCGNNARITWRRPGGVTPARQDNADLNGRGWSGVHTRPGSRDGLHGEDGRSGEPGIRGANGVPGPNIEMWVKELTSMPSLDLNGEDGRKGGRGQRGGRGGSGGDGHVGEIRSFFWKWCHSDPGDGGDGGDGGTGGRGGRGGSGGNGGKVTIGVLEGTLRATVASHSFRLKNQGGQRGRGGEGGSGGDGGRGGRSGVGKICKDARDGRNGAKGQPGRVADDGAALGIDGEVQFFEFTNDAWEDQLTRPWLSEVIPSDVFPGDRLTVRGSRFSFNDRLVLGGVTLVPIINADESISVNVPLTVGGGAKSIFVRRADGTQSNRHTVWVKPQLDPIMSTLNPAAKITLNGRAFVSGASVLVNGAATPAEVTSATQLTFEMSGTGGSGSAGGTVSVHVRNPDGFVSNMRSASTPRILEVPFRFGVHNLSFDGFSDGVPSWDTFKATFGAAEVWHELFDPIFGHPVLTVAFYYFYKYFLKGKANGGLATGFCTSESSLVADKFWRGDTDAHAITKATVHEYLTAVMGRMLSKEVIIHFHDQSREGVARVEQTYRDIEATFLRGADWSNAPLLFFIPSGAVWDSGYMEKLSSTHCVMPWRFVYPEGHGGPSLSPEGFSTLTDPDGVEMFVWDSNSTEDANCKLVFRRSGSRVDFEYISTNSPKFRSQDGITLGMMTNGQLLADQDMPFSGPLGLTRFVLDFLLSPADLQVTDLNGLRTGTFGSQLLAEIPDSHPCFLAPGVYLLPASMPLTRRIVGTDAGHYTYNSINPDGSSLLLQDVPTETGQEDVLSVSADGTQIRFTPATEKTFHLTLARQVGSQLRALAVRGLSGGLTTDVDITVSPEMSLLRVGNRSGAKTVEVRAFTIDKTVNSPLNQKMSVNLPTQHDLVVAVPDWTALNLNVQTVSFE
jgi:hypothetical protein